MVDVSAKRVTLRRAVAQGSVRLTREISDAIRASTVAKGNVFETARIAAIQAAKKTSDLIPLCHPVPITHISVRFHLDREICSIEAEVTAEAKTGVEMEALTAVSVASLVIYDMCKGIDKGMILENIHLVEKEGGKSGRYRNETAIRRDGDTEKGETGQRREGETTKRKWR
jgi:cyclic pyranopterin phosphate synthase